MKPYPLCFGSLLVASLMFSSCDARHDANTPEQEAHVGQPKPAPAPAPPSLRDTLQRLTQQLDTVRRIGCWDEDFARLMTVHHIGAQRLAAVEIAQGQDSTLRTLAQHVLKGHARDNHVLTLALARQPPSGQEYRPGNTKDPFVRRMAAALAPLRQLPPTPGPSMPTSPPSCRCITKPAWPWPRSSWPLARMSS